MSKLTRLPMVNRGLLYWDGDGWRDDIGRRWLIDPRAAVLEELRAFMHRAWRRRMTTDRINREWYTVAEIADRFGVERSIARRRLAKRRGKSVEHAYLVTTMALGWELLS